MKKILATVVFALSCVCLIPRQAQAAALCTSVIPNLALNCGFESGDFTSWTLTGNDVPLEQDILYGVEGTDPLNLIDPNSGSFQVFFADLVANSTTLSQTVVTTPGQLYRVTWYLAQDTAIVSPYSNSFMASFGGAPLINLSAVPIEGYTKYVADGLATSASTTVSFTVGNDLGEFLLDDISVGNVPEPASWAMMFGGAMVFALLAWRQKRAVR